MRLSSKEDRQKQLDRKITKTAYKTKENYQMFILPSFKNEAFTENKHIQKIHGKVIVSDDKELDKFFH